MGFSGGSDGKESACNAGDQGSILGLGRSAGEGNGNALQYSCLENSKDRFAHLSACNAGDPGSIPGSGGSPGEGNGTPLQYFCLENPRDGVPGGLPSVGLHRVGHN